MGILSSFDFPNTETNLMTENLTRKGCFKSGLRTKTKGLKHNLNSYKISIDGNSQFGNYCFITYLQTISTSIAQTLKLGFFDEATEVMLVVLSLRTQTSFPTLSLRSGSGRASPNYFVLFGTCTALVYSIYLYFTLKPLY
jgi:hypothetical protein